MKAVMFCGAVLVASGFLAAQEVRYQLGKQVIAFEEDFERKYDDLSARKKVLPSLQSAVQAFFQLSLSDAEKFIDAARLELMSADQKNFAKGFMSLRLSTKSRWLDTTAPSIAWSLNKGYETAESMALPVQIQLSLKESPSVTQKRDLKTEHLVERVPAELVQPKLVGELPEGDYVVDAKLVDKQQEFQMPWQMLSLSDRRDQRLVEVTEQIKVIPKEPRNALRQSLELNLKLLRDLARDRVQETDYPAHRILLQTEKWLKQAQANELAVDISKAGQYWLDYSKVGRSGIVRVQVPRDVNPARPFKVLIAYHGAGGSENMFFDSYGAGRLATLVEMNGYVLVAPRQPLLAGMLSLQELLDSLAESLPIDRQQVDLIGHSMGAGQLIQQVEQNPGLVRGCVILGGGRAVTKVAAWTNVPVFAAAGDVDFGRRGVLAFAQSAKQAKAVVEERIYENVEHLAIVQVAFNDIFAWLGKLPTPAPK